MAKKLNKVATKKAIIDKCNRSKTLSINADMFDTKIKTVADYLEACDFVRIEPIYF